MHFVVPKYYQSFFIILLNDKNVDFIRNNQIFPRLKIYSIRLVHYIFQFNIVNQIAINCDGKIRHIPSVYLKPFQNQHAYKSFPRYKYCNNRISFKRQNSRNVMNRAVLVTGHIKKRQNSKKEINSETERAVDISLFIRLYSRTRSI